MLDGAEEFRSVASLIMKMKRCKKCALITIIVFMVLIPVHITLVRNYPGYRSLWRESIRALGLVQIRDIVEARGYRTVLSESCSTLFDSVEVIPKAKKTIIKVTGGKKPDVEVAVKQVVAEVQEWYRTKDMQVKPVEFEFIESQGPPPMDMTPKWVLDQSALRNWKLAHHQQVAGEHIIEYCPKTESVYDWTQLITENYHACDGNEVNLNLVKESFIGSLRIDCISLETKIISQNDHEIIFEWWTKGTYSGQFPPQHEIKRIARNEYGLYFLAYAAVGGKMQNNQRDEWLKFIKNAQISNN